MVALGTTEEKKRINYNSRSGLVKPSDVNTLPAPAETVESESTYFPEDPEIKRARLLAGTEKPHERSGEISPELMQRKKAPGSLGDTSSTKNKFRHLDHEESAHEMAIKGQEQRKALLERRKALRGGDGAAPRRYLTEPPKEYRTPAETAEAGKVGEKETDPNVKKKKSFFENVWGS